MRKSEPEAAGYRVVRPLLVKGFMLRTPCSGASMDRVDLFASLDNGIDYLGASLTVVAAGGLGDLAEAMSLAMQVDTHESQQILQEHGWFTWGSYVFIHIPDGFDYQAAYHRMGVEIASAYKDSTFFAGDEIKCRRAVDPVVIPAGPAWLCLGAPDYLGMRAYFDSGYWELTHIGSPER